MLLYTKWSCQQQVSTERQQTIWSTHMHVQKIWCLQDVLLCYIYSMTKPWLLLWHEQRFSFSSHPVEQCGVLVLLQEQPSKLTSPEEHWRKMFSTHVHSLGGSPPGHIGSVVPVHWAVLGITVLPSGQLGCRSTSHWQLSISRIHPDGQMGLLSFLQAHIPPGSVTAVNWLGHVDVCWVEHLQLSTSIV